jgi:hypothetical protein
MTAIEYMSARRVALEAYTKKVNEACGSGDGMGRLLRIACLDAFSLGFDCAMESLNKSFGGVEALPEKVKVVEPESTTAPTATPTP